MSRRIPAALVALSLAAADFTDVNPNVFGPDDPLSPAYPSATFRYDRGDVARLLAGRPFRALREEISDEMQRRFVVLERVARSDDEDGKRAVSLYQVVEHANKKAA